MRQTTLRIGFALLGVFLILLVMMCAGAARADTGDTSLEDTGDTAVEYTVYYRGSGCVSAEDTDGCGCDTSTRGTAGALFLVALLTTRRRRS